MLLFLLRSRPHPDIHSFPTRRSSDLYSRLMHPGGEVAAARAAGQAGTAYILSTISGHRLEERMKAVPACPRSEEHTSELQSRENLVCRLLLRKKNRRHTTPRTGTATC